MDQVETFEITREQALELYNFITTHLEVSNDTLYVEQLMMDLEERFDITPELN